MNRVENFSKKKHRINAHKPKQYSNTVYANNWKNTGIHGRFSIEQHTGIMILLPSSQYSYFKLDYYRCCFAQDLISFVKESWCVSGRPLICCILRENDFGHDQKLVGELLELLASFRRGYCAGVPVRVGRLQTLIKAACTEHLDFLFGPECDYKLVEQMSLSRFFAFLFCPSIIL